MMAKWRKRLAKPTCSPGFSLSEIILVVVLIGVVAALAVPFILRPPNQDFNTQQKVVLSDINNLFRYAAMEGSSTSNPVNIFSQSDYEVRSDISDCSAGKKVGDITYQTRSGVIIGNVSNSFGDMVNGKQGDQVCLVPKAGASAMTVFIPQDGTLATVLP